MSRSVAGLSIRAMLAKATTLLLEAQSEPKDSREAALEAEVLLRHVCGLTRAQLLTRSAHELSADQLDVFEALTARRLRGEPVAYITGHREFYGLDFLVDRRVLVPRPESELLVEIALAEANRRSLARPVIADVGTGSGAVAISIAKALPGARVFAIDVSASALAVAAENVRRHGLASRVELLRGDLLDPLPVTVDILVANLPYVAESVYPSLQREVVDFEPSTALLAGKDGLAIYRRLLRRAARHLSPMASVLLEIDPSQVPPIRRLAELHLPAASIEVARDYAGKDRVVIIRLPNGH